MLFMKKMLSFYKFSYFSKESDPNYTDKLQYYWRKINKTFRNDIREG